MAYETEILGIISEIFDTILTPNTYTILINNKKILYDVLSNFGIDLSLYKTICATLDKLNKMSIDEIKLELLSKGVTEEMVIKIMQFVCDVGNNINQGMENSEMLNFLMKSNYITNDTFIEISLLFDYLNIIGCAQNIKFNPVLSRGLDYYTGLIYEVIYNDKNIMDSTICAGGRYDDIIGKLSRTKNINAIGFSVGLDRLVTIIENNKSKLLECKQQKIVVFVASVGKNMVAEKIKLCNELRNIGLMTDMLYTNNPKMMQQLQIVFNNRINYMIIIGENEIKTNTVKLKYIDKNQEIVINRGDLVKDFFIK